MTEPAVPGAPASSEPSDPNASDDRRAILATMRPDTLKRIEKAVLELFSSQDFHDVSLLDVAKAANVSLQTIYKYFGSKEVLVYAMLDVMLGRLAERMIDHLQGIDDARERLRKTCWVTLDYMDKHPAVMMLLFTAVPITRHRNIRIYESPDLMGSFLSVFKDGQERGVLNNKVSSKILLDVFMGVVGRVVLMHIVRGEQRSLIDQFDELFGILWRAMSMPDEA
ncbi:MAG TPA: TetR/AcrR family transcriptional regulator [Candidatus Aquabacterium excrementipullorum]|nr:TetR/AcrR family transcriptional regulator [Candidatus Aquabacterium excrementipullorum]